MSSLHWTGSNPHANVKMSSQFAAATAPVERNFEVRPQDPNSSIPRALFLGARFSSTKTNHEQLKLRSQLISPRFYTTLFLLTAAMLLPCYGRAQSVFYFPVEVRWGNAVLPSGDYTIISLDVKDNKVMVTFAVPQGPSKSADAGAQIAGPQDDVSNDSAPADAGLFKIRNPRNQPVPYAQAQTIYLSACKAVEQEFGRTDPVRPRLTLALGEGGDDRVFFPKREIELNKWNDFSFAQGVVLLAVEEMLTPEKKYALAKTAVVQAESTVDVSDLRRLRAR
jgi:hypothetical protein